MEYLWLNKKQNDKLIVFFNGWGMDEKSVSFLEFGKYDVIMFYDYRNLSSVDFDFGAYKNKFIVSWSTGVFISNLFFDKLHDAEMKIALNGTLNPVDDEFGIPVNIYNLTVNNFNALSCKKFIKRMFAGEEIPVLSDRTVEELKQELISIRDCRIDKCFSFDKAVISENDKIIPSQNQHNFWDSRNNVQVKKIQGGHYPFLNFRSWDDILNA